jgi:hypothetical protein
MTTYPHEIHVTVRNADIAAFRAFCAAHSLKPIVLDLQDRTGTTVIQDVMTSERIYSGMIPVNAYKHSRATAHKLQDAGF